MFFSTINQIAVSGKIQHVTPTEFEDIANLIGYKHCTPNGVCQGRSIKHCAWYSRVQNSGPHQEVKF